MKEKVSIMTTSTTNTDSTSSKRTLSVEECESVISAYKTLHGVFATYSSTLPAFEKMGEAEYDNLHKGALKALVVAKKARKEANRAAFRTKVNAILDTHTASVRAAKSEYDGLSDTMKAIMPKFPTVVNVPVSALSDIYPEGASEEQVRLLLKDMDYTLVKGGAKNDKVCIQVPLAPKTETK